MVKSNLNYPLISDKLVDLCMDFTQGKTELPESALLLTLTSSLGLDLGALAKESLLDKALRLTEALFPMNQKFQSRLNDSTNHEALQGLGLLDS